MSTLKVGDKVQLNWESHALHGATGTISEVGDGTAGVMFDGIGYDRWYLIERLIPVTAEPEQEESPEHTIAELTNALYEMSIATDRQREIADNYRDDIAHFENVMREQKIEQGWCDEGTNEVIKELNKGFKRWHIDGYEQEFEIEVNVVVTVDTTHTVLVMATSEEEAYDNFNNDPTCYIDDYAVRDIVDTEVYNGYASVDMTA